MARLQIHTGLPDVSLDVVVPEYARAAKAKGRTSSEYYSDRSLPVLWLLHGYSGTGASWLRYTQIELFAEEKGIVAVCPSVGNSFYANMSRGEQWENHLADRLWAIVHGMLPTSDRREDNFIAGLSMGGYGALRMAFSRPERYSHAASFSGALEVPQEYAAGRMSDMAMMRDIFGEPEAVAGSGHDLWALAERVKTKESAAPAVFLSCGRADGLYDANVRYKNHLEALGLSLDWDEDGSGHEWRFWNRQVERFLNRLPL